MGFAGGLTSLLQNEHTAKCVDALSCQGNSDFK